MKTLKFLSLTFASLPCAAAGMVAAHGAFVAAGNADMPGYAACLLLTVGMFALAIGCVIRAERF